MNKVINLTGEEVNSKQAKALFTMGMPVYMISYVLKVFQSDCLNLLTAE